MISWTVHLDIIASRKGIEGAAKRVFVKVFLPCDPNCGTGRMLPVVPKESDLTYETDKRALTKAYKLLGFPDRESGKGEAVILPWLLDEYHNPQISRWQINSESPAQKLEGFLQDLDYIQQRQKVEISIQGGDIAKVIMIQVDGSSSQRWLVKRLSLKVINHSQARGFSITAKSKWNRDIKHFWDALSKFLDGSEDIEEMIQGLCDRLQVQPLVMSIYGIQELEPETLKLLLEVFWERLSDEMSKRSWSIDRGDCVLFLTTNLGTAHDVEADYDYGVTLGSWEFVTVEQMQQWLRFSQVRQFLGECSGESPDEACLDLLPQGKLPTENLGPPEEVLNKICRSFEIESLTELESYWKLAS